MQHLLILRDGEVCDGVARADMFELYGRLGDEIDQAAW
jgi:hypothetical protein